MKVLFLSRYNQMGASSRIRCYQFLPSLQYVGVEAMTSSLISNDMLKFKYLYGKYKLRDLLFTYLHRIYILIRKYQFDLLWIEKEAMPWLPVWLELLLLRGRPYILDFDDAVFHSYDQHASALVRFIYRRRIDRLMVSAHMVVAGNHYLAARAKAAGASWVKVMPSVVDLARYNIKQDYSASSKLSIVWIGSPSTVKYLFGLRTPLAALAKRRDFILRVIGGGCVTMPGVNVEAIDWTLESEAAAIKNCDIGIMPLNDGLWEKGKCAYKLIQYMACGLPVVASAVGANLDVVKDGETGFLVDTPLAWEEKLELLLDDVMLRQHLGRAGRLRAEKEYSLQQITPQFIDLILKVGS
jgi:glycosyltransferase involved in cell wall biosynthesis